MKLTTIGEGTSEIQRLVIARQLLAASDAACRATLPSACSRAIRARSPARSRSIEDEVPRAPSWCARSSPAPAARICRRHRPAGRRQEHARRSPDRASSARARHARVGVIAVDPTSPFTGGAVLGDRVRMQAHAADAGVFIRSMATRGHLGGLARATGDAALVLDAAGKDVVIIETVGVGQDEVDIVRTADVSIVTLVPGTGDEVQALKAGIMEIADIFVVNKADREGADRLVSSVEANLALHTYGAGRMAAADREDRGDDRAGRAGAGRRDRAIPRALRSARRRRAAATRSEYRLRELVAHRFMDHLERDGARRRASSARSSIASPRARSIRTRPRTICWRRALSDRRRSLDRETSADRRHESRPRSRRHRRAAISRRRSRSIATRSASRSKRPRRSRRSACARTSCRSARPTLELLEATARRFADREVRREARARPAPHHAARRRHPRGAGAAQGARRAADRRAAAARRAKARSSRSSTRRARTACWSS